MNQITNPQIVEVLTGLEEVRKGAVPFWNVPQTTALFLHMMVRVTQAKKVLEIGTSNGYSGIHLAEALSHNQGVLYTVESHAERFKIAGQNFQRAGLTPFIKQIFGHAPEILPEVNEVLDLIFLDATKLEYKSYLEVLIPKLRSGGVMIADNCVSHRKELGEFFKLVEEAPELESVLLPFDSGLLMAIKN